MEDSANPSPECPHCGAELSSPRVTPKLGAFPELLTYRCGTCGEVTTVEATEGRDGGEQD